MSLRGRSLNWVLVTLCLCLSVPVFANPVSSGVVGLPEFARMDQAGLLLLNARQQPVKAKAEQVAFVPASTTKLLTAFLALSQWGEGHRFKTDFFIKPSKKESGQGVELWVKGYGDPFLISEALEEAAAELAKRLRSQGVNAVSAIVLDSTYFDKRAILPGTGRSDNPYDAVPSALAANFNTLFLSVEQGQVRSAEPQTPLTPLARTLGNSLSVTKRVNLGQDPRRAQHYFAELLAAFLRHEGVGVSERVEWHKLKASSVPFYRYWNSRTLAEMVRPMMRFSTNFIANQLALILSAENYGAPATPEKVVRMFQHKLARQFDWHNAYIEDGAGLSRNNRLSPRQLIEVLEVFRPWKHLLPEVEKGVWAKSGSLIGVSALAGYIEKEQEWWSFALIINQRAPYHYRNRVARALSREVNAL